MEVENVCLQERETMMKRVLIADDDEDSVQLYKTVIEMLGHNVVAIARNSQEAIIKAYTLHPDVAFLDIKMDYRNAGIHASNRIKDRFPETKVYFLSAYPKDAFNLDLVNTDYDGYVEKQEFMSVVEDLLKN
ncbi:MAG: response regulator [Candidatus Omnitrophica bacterium]|nr:response regulator [Candidatus Omnitrophota bacterium]MBU1996727.1 response regulator [Candidatus Omnitrophota bacterium]MBU4334584.1 response regulator [Candidatus Omnitrophota bacterium]